MSKCFAIIYSISKLLFKNKFSQTKKKKIKDNTEHSISVIAINFEGFANQFERIWVLCLKVSCHLLVNTNAIIALSYTHKLLLYKNKRYKNKEVEIGKKNNNKKKKKKKNKSRTHWGWKIKKEKLEITMIYISLKIYLQNNKLDKVIFCDVIGCSIWVYNFMSLKCGIKIFCIPNISS